MQAPSDIRLLRDYAEAGQEAAFRELVQRYTDFVFSSALRQLGSPDLAADIAQSVFVDLARKAGAISARFPDHGSLAGWLHRSTRFAALNHLRDSRRRSEHERQAMEHLLTDSAPEAEWEQIRPLLDEALESLDNDDREALLLRYFKSQDLQTIGLAFGVSEDAAQKRVSRAVERLRRFFARRRVTVESGALAAVLSAHAVQSAPAGLIGAIATAALAGAKLGAVAAATTSASAAFLASQKVALAAVIATTFLVPVLVQQRLQSTVIEQERLLGRQATLLTQLEADNARLAQDLAALARPSALPPRELHELLRLRSLVGRLQREVRELERSSATAAAASTNLLTATQALWSGHAERLKQWLEANAEAKTPELRFLDDQAWLDAIYPIELTSPEDFRRAMGNVRANAELRVLDRLHGALRRYAAAHEGQFPADPTQLGAYLAEPLEDAILQRYQVVKAASLVPELQSGEEWVITQKAPVDADWDSRLTVGLHGGEMADCRITNRWQLKP